LGAAPAVAAGAAAAPPLRSLALPALGAAALPPQSHHAFLAGAPAALKPAAAFSAGGGVPRAGFVGLSAAAAPNAAPAAAFGHPGAAGGLGGGVKGLISGLGNLRLGGGGAPLAPVPECKPVAAPSAQQAALDAKAAQFRRQMSVAGMVAAAQPAPVAGAAAGRFNVGGVPLGGGAYLGGMLMRPPSAQPAAARPGPW
jgi:hypothetical protein